MPTFSNIFATKDWYLTPEKFRPAGVDTEDIDWLSREDGTEKRKLDPDTFVTVLVIRFAIAFVIAFVIEFVIAFAIAFVIAFAIAFFIPTVLLPIFEAYLLCILPNDVLYFILQMLVLFSINHHKNNSYIDLSQI